MYKSRRNPFERYNRPVACRITGRPRRMSYDERLRRLERDQLVGPLEERLAYINRFREQMGLSPWDPPESPPYPSSRRRRRWHRRWRRRRNPRWSRPLSEAFMDPSRREKLPTFPEDIAKNSILLIGGDPSDIPDWISENFRTKQVKISGTSIRDLIGVFDADVMIVLPKLTDKNTTYQAYDYARDNSIPILVMHYSWPLLITEARDKGLGWIADAYPHKVYIPEEVLKRKSEIREEKRLERERPRTPRSLMLAEKRRRRFVQAGIMEEHGIHGRPTYIRRDPGSKCCLCDTRISYLFRLHFDIPGQEQMTTFFPVGSTCISVWLNSLPDSKDKERIIKQVTAELEKADKEKKVVRRGSGKKKTQVQSKKRKPKAKKKKGITPSKKKAKAKKKSKKKKKKTVSRKVKKKKHSRIPRQRLLDFSSAEDTVDDDE